MNSNSYRELLEALTSSIEEDAEKLSAKAGALIYSKINLPINTYYFYQVLSA